MTRRAHAKPAGIQLFPFLAVLICTMGALVVLLHAFARHGQVQAIKAAEAKAQAMEMTVEDFHWRIGHLRTARAKTEAQLRDERLKLAHVEDHERRLRENLEKLKIAAAELERAIQENSGQSRQNSTELAAVKAQIAETQAAIEAARKQGDHPRATYSVVPYEGRNATHRRPIYIECRKGLIVLQPEGIELTPRDFAGAFGPGNPLAAALRAQREYLARQAGGKLPQEPYPLLLVRPEGVAAYYAARAALDSWGSDFGYELVGSDWDLKFPDPDPQLSELTRRVVDEARLRHRQYVLSSPQVAKSRSRPVYRARPHGGFAAVGGPGTGGSSRGYGGGWDDFAGDWARGESSTPNDSQDGLGGTPGGGSMLEDPYADGDGGLAPGNAGRGPSPTSGSDRRAKSGQGALADGARSPSAESGAGSSLAGQGRNTDAPGGPGGPAEAGQSQASASADPTRAPSSGTFGHSDGASSDAAGATPSHEHTVTAAKPKPESIANARGRDWGLPEKTLRSVPATRPILVECYPDRLVLVPESPGRPAKEIRLPGDARESMDELVSAVWDHMQAWGTAGKGLYWRPELSMDVKPGAQGRFAEIEALLADSGLDVRPRAARAVKRPPPSPRQPLRQ